MKSLPIFFTLGRTGSTLEKLGVLVLLVLFAGIAYVILPKMTEKRIRDYHDQSEWDEELDSHDSHKETMEQEETE